MPTLVTPTDVPGLDIDNVRKCFEAIWQKNTVEVRIVRENNSQGGDYFHDDEDVAEVKTFIFINIQGTQSDYYERKQYGIDSTASVYHCYVRYTEDIGKNDRILFEGETWKIININRSRYAGAITWIEFDIQKVNTSV